MVKSQLLDGSASGIGSKSSIANAVTRHAPVPDRPIKSVVDAALIVEKSRFSDARGRPVVSVTSCQRVRDTTRRMRTFVIVTAQRAVRAAFCCASCQFTGINRAVTEPSVSLPDEFPTQRSRADTFSGSIDPSERVQNVEVGFADNRDRLWNTSQSRRSRRASAFDGILRDHSVISFSGLNKKGPLKAWAD